MATKTEPRPPDLSLASSVGFLGRHQIAERIGGITVRTLDRMIATGEFPARDTTVKGKPLWRITTFAAWCESLSSPAPKSEA